MKCGLLRSMIPASVNLSVCNAEAGCAKIVLFTMATFGDPGNIVLWGSPSPRRTGKAGEGVAKLLRLLVTL